MCAGFDLDALLASSVPPAKSKVTLQLPKGKSDVFSKQPRTPSPSGLAGPMASDCLLKHGQKRPPSLHYTATPPGHSGPAPVAIVVHKPESDESLLPGPSLTSLSSCSKEAEGGKEEEAEDRATGAARKSFTSSSAGWRPVPRAVAKDGPSEVSGVWIVDSMCRRREVREQTSQPQAPDSYVCSGMCTFVLLSIYTMSRKYAALSRQHLYLVARPLPSKHCLTVVCSK